MDKQKILMIRGGGLCRMCRICLTTDVTLANLKSYSAQLKGPIIESLASCASIRVKKHDGMPLFICKLCYVQMLQVNKFQKLAKTSEQRLKWYLKKLDRPERSSSGKLSSKSISKDRFDSGSQSYSKEKVTDSCTLKKINVPTKLNSSNKLEKSCHVSQQNLNTSLLPTKVSPVNTTAVNCSVSSTKPVALSATTKSYTNSLLLSINTTQTPLNTIVAPINTSTTPINTVSPICTAVTAQKTSVSSVNTPVPPIIEINIEDDVIVINDDDEVEISTLENEQNTHRQMNDRYPLSNKNNTVLDLQTTRNSENGSVSNNGSENLQNRNEETATYTVNTQNYTLPSNINSPICDDDDDMALVIDESASEPDQSRSDTENIPKNDNQNIKKQITLTKFARSISKSRQDQIDFFEQRQLNLKFQAVSFECGICNTQFSSRNEIIQHKKKHPNMKVFKCDLCGYRSARWSLLNKHKRVTEGKCNNKQPSKSSKRTCGLCKKTFDTVLKFFNHRRDHHSTDKPLPTCTVCSIEFKQLKELKQHSIVHPACTVCEKVFIDSFSLISHECEPQLIHECDICNKRFKKLTALNNHRKTHGIKEGEKIYLCDICRERFDTLNSLVEHKRTHK